VIRLIGKVELAALVREGSLKLGAALVEGVTDVLQEDEAEHDVFVLGGVHAGAQLVGGGPESLFEVLIHSAIQSGTATLSA
jgi:hypothetical protein